MYIHKKTYEECSKPKIEGAQVSIMGEWVNK